MYHLSTWRFVHHTLAIRFRAMNQLQDCHPDTTALARGDEGCLGLKMRHWVPTGYPQNGDLRQLREIWGIWWWTMINLTSGLWKEHAIVGQIHITSSASNFLRLKDSESIQLPTGIKVHEREIHQNVLLVSVGFASWMQCRISLTTCTASFSALWVRHW